jgi:hypothetical protein
VVLLRGAVPCAQLEKVAEEYKDKVKIFKIDTDVEADLATSLQVFFFCSCSLRNKCAPVCAASPRAPASRVCACICSGRRNPARGMAQGSALPVQEAPRARCPPSRSSLSHSRWLSAKKSVAWPVREVRSGVQRSHQCLCQVFAMPTLLFIKDGKIRQRAEGAMLAPKIKDLTEHIFFDGLSPPPARQRTTAWCPWRRHAICPHASGHASSRLHSHKPLTHMRAGRP